MEVDLSNCDREPIHLLGKIQTHGLLLAFDSSTWRLSYYSANAIDLLISEEDAKEQRSIDALLPEHLVEFAKKFLSKEDSSRPYRDSVSFSTSKGPVDYQCHLSNGKGHCIIEFEPSTSSDREDGKTHLSWLDEATYALRKTETEADLAAEISSRFREFTGFDRVMVYRFDDNFDGEVIGEDKAFGLDSFLGLRYPASDIPVQARKLYKSNLIRAIRDVDDPGIPVIGCAQEAILDQSYTIYRSVSPIHIQYLKNMGVRATHANSLIVDGELWGMLICHHYAAPLDLSLQRRLTSLFYTKSIECWLEDAEMERLQTRIKTVDGLVEELELNPDNHDLFNLIRSCWQVFESVFKADGFAIQSGEDSISWPEKMKIPAEALENGDTLFKPGDHIAFRDSVAEPDHESSIAGFAAISLRKDPPARLILLRKEKTKVYNWAGNPKKPVIETDSNDPLLKLSPRKSFELWQEKVGGTCLPWTTEDHICLTRIRNTIRSSYENKPANTVSEDDFALAKEANKQMKKEIFQLKRDLEELSKQEEHRNVVLRESVKISIANSNLLANLSHEIRTPLNGIIGLSELLRTNEDAQVREFAEHINSSGERMLLLFTKLLSFSKLENVEIQKTTGVCTLEDLLEATLLPHQLASQQKAITLDILIHNKSTQIITDRFLIEQILSNLIGNAIKYTATGGHVEVDVKCLIRDGEYAIKLSIEDNGRGIDESEQNRIFEPFYTVEKETNVEDNSTGLGLYLIRSYIKSLGGTIELISEPKKGSRFTVIIPVEMEE